MKPSTILSPAFNTEVHNLMSAYRKIQNSYGVSFPISLHKLEMRHIDVFVAAQQYELAKKQRSADNNYRNPFNIQYRLATKTFKQTESEFYTAYAALRKTIDRITNALSEIHYSTFRQVQKLALTK